MTKINCFIPFAEKEQAQKTIDGLKSSALVNKIYLLAGADVQGTVEGCEVIKVNNLNASATMRAYSLSFWTVRRMHRWNTAFLCHQNNNYM